MGNKLAPRLVTVTDVPTLITENRLRSGLLMLNGDNDVKLSNMSNVSFLPAPSPGYPWEANTEWEDDESFDAYYGICDTGLESEVVIWERE